MKKRAAAETAYVRIPIPTEAVAALRRHMDRIDAVAKIVGQVGLAVGELVAIAEAARADAEREIATVKRVIRKARRRR